MPRLIDADALIKEIDKLRANTVGTVIAKQAIRRMVEIAPTVQTFGGWLSVKDRLPENGQNILVASAKTGTQYVSHKDLIYFDPDGNACVPTSYLQTFVFTHWAPLPEPPKEDKDDA